MRAPLAGAVAALALVAGTSAVAAPGEAPSAGDFLQVDRLVAHGAASSHVRIYGRDADHGAWVSILPSLGRGVEDYTEAFGSTLTTRLVQGGYRVVLVQPRGIGRSTGDLTPAHVSMSLLAEDLEASFDALGIERVSLIGHAFGNRLARTFATLHPGRVDRLVLMAAGGSFPMSEAAQACLRSSFDLKLPDAVRLARIRCAFFAPGNDPQVWRDGWYPELAAAQIQAARRIDGAFFKRAGGKPFLLLQAEHDSIAPPERAGRALRAELGDQVTYVEIRGAGHALAPERPGRIADAILGYLGRPR